MGVLPKKDLTLYIFSLTNSLVFFIHPTKQGIKKRVKSNLKQTLSNLCEYFFNHIDILDSSTYKN